MAGYQRTVPAKCPRCGGRVRKVSEKRFEEAIERGEVQFCGPCDGFHPGNVKTEEEK